MYGLLKLVSNILFGIGAFCCVLYGVMAIALQRPEIGVGVLYGAVSLILALILRLILGYGKPDATHGSGARQAPHTVCAVNGEK